MQLLDIGLLTLSGLMFLYLMYALIYPERF